MNKKPYVATSGQYAGQTPPPTHTTGWAFSDAVIKHKCPRCGSDPGFYCETPSGRKAWPPHSERVVVGPEHQIKATTNAADFLKSITIVE